MGQVNFLDDPLTFFSDVSEFWGAHKADVVEFFERAWEVTKTALCIIIGIGIAFVDMPCFFLGLFAGALIPKFVMDTVVEEIEGIWDNARWYHFIAFGVAAFFSLPLLPYLVPFCFGCYCMYRMKS